MSNIFSSAWHGGCWHDAQKQLKSSRIRLHTHKHQPMHHNHEAVSTMLLPFSAAIAALLLNDVCLSYAQNILRQAVE